MTDGANHPSDQRKACNTDCRKSPAGGLVTVVSGCMFSGKTTRLLRRIESYPTGHVLALKHAIDRRYHADAIVSHAGKAYPATALSDAREIPKLLRPGIRLVAIDEAHFFEPVLVEVITGLADCGVHVMVTALDRDSWGRLFPMVQDLASLADERITTTAQCARCGAVGCLTQRLTPIVESDMVGGPERYEPRCRACWTPPPKSPPA